MCNYGPGGNWLGAPVYEQGEPGSNCPSGTQKTSDGLCAWNDNGKELLGDTKYDFTFFIKPCNFYCSDHNLIQTKNANWKFRI